MYVVYTEKVYNELKDKHTLLEVDTFIGADHTAVPAYIVVEPGSIDLDALPSLERNTAKHNKLVAAYKAGKFTEVRALLEELYRAINSDIDGYYTEIAGRICNQDDLVDPADDWYWRDQSEITNEA